MRVLVACEFSGRVRDAFGALGHDAWSCDLVPTEVPGRHIQGDVLDVIGDSAWDLVVAHPPCRYLAVSGARWWVGRESEQRDAIAFVFRIVSGCSCALAVENPIGVLSRRWRKPDQIIQPWQFGHGEVKATCLWLRDLPLLVPTDVVAGRVPLVARMGESKNRSRERSRTYTGIAVAMATQWGS